MVLFSNKYSNFKNSMIDVVSKIDLKDTNYVPQGICYAEGYYFLTMYDFTKKTNSVLLYIFCRTVNNNDTISS